MIEENSKGSVKDAMARMKFMNTHVDNITMADAVQEIDRMIREKKNSYVVTPNVDHIVRIETDIEFKEIYDKADLVLTDGQPLIWISKLYGRPICEKVSGSDLFPKICELSAKKGYTMFFLGAAEGVADIAARKLRHRYPGLQIVRTYSPPYGFEKDRQETQKIIDMVCEAHPDVLILALGTPKQEKFYFKHREKLSVPMTLAVGASIDFVAGNVKRAPKWMSDRGLEWLFRITQDPKRMFKRYIIDDTKILGLAWKYRKG